MTSREVTIGCTILLTISMIGQGGFALIVAGQSQSTTISIGQIPDERIKIGEEFDIDVSGYVGLLCNAKLEVYEKNPNNLFIGEQKIGEKTIYSNQLETTSGKFDTSVSATITDEVADGDGEAELQAKIIGQCLGTSSARSNQQSTSIYSADAATIQPEVVFSRPIGQQFAGETEVLAAKGANRGGEAGEYSTVQIEFPSFTDSSNQEYFGESWAVGPNGPTKTEIAPGDTIYDTNGDTVDADHWQFEIAVDYWKRV